LNSYYDCFVSLSGVRYLRGRKDRNAASAFLHFGFEGWFPLLLLRNKVLQSRSATCGRYFRHAVFEKRNMEKSFRRLIAGETPLYCHRIGVRNFSFGYLFS